jgi:predicted TIM-barrel fold metal-dependent hydrolase
MAFDCFKQWDQLTPTEDAFVRNCADCGQSVHFIDDQTQLDRAALQGKCVAFVNQLPEHISPGVSKQLLTMQEHHTSLRAAVIRRVTLGLPRKRDNDKLRAFLDEFPDPEK